MPAVECVPNISEGRDLNIVREVAGAVRGVPGVTLVSCDSDADHNRSVLTFAGEPDAVLEAAFRVYARAIDLIDLRRHKGAHPRMGAVDVCPFVPVGDITMEECAALARRLGERVGRELKVPVYLYESAAARPERKNLADIRKGEFEGLREQIGKDPARRPDFGPNAIHESFGCTAIGARFFLIAYNVNLDTRDVKIAKDIAKTIREKDGGMPSVKAMGFMLEDEGLAQVSMNLVDYRKTSPAQAYARIDELARARGVAIRESEIVGVLPRDAAELCFAQALRVKNFTPKLILENNMSQTANYMTGVNAFLDDLASASPTPGGGAAAAVLGGIGCALTSMVGNLTAGKKKYAEVDAQAREIVKQADALRAVLLGLYDEDVAAFDKVSAAFKLPKDDDAQKTKRAVAIQNALKTATLSPLKCAKAAAEGLRLARDMARIGNANAISDAGVAALSLHSAAYAATLNMRINLANITDKDFVSDHTALVKTLEAEADQLAAETRASVLAKI